MSKEMEQLERTVKGGATIAVLAASVRNLGPWPVDYLKVEGNRLLFMWIGEEEPVHDLKVEKMVALEDGAVEIFTDGGDSVLVEWAWRDPDQDRLRAWAQQVKGDPEIRHYPEGGIRYAL